MTDGPYEACLINRDDTPHDYGVSGPGKGLGYYAGYLYPENTFKYRDEAEKVARLMNLAYKQGAAARSAEIRALIG